MPHGGTTNYTGASLHDFHIRFDDVMLSAKPMIYDRSKEPNYLTKCNEYSSNVCYFIFVLFSVVGKANSSLLENLLQELVQPLSSAVITPSIHAYHYVSLRRQ